MTTQEFVVDEALVAEAYERVKEELAALRPEELELPTLDIHAAVKTVLGALPEIRALRERMVKELPAFDVAAFDRLEDYALALSRAHARYQIATTSPNELDQVVAEAAKLRERLVASARGLVLFGLFDARKVEQLKHGNGYANVAQDLQALSAAFEESWPKIEGKTPFSLESVHSASRLALRLTRLVGLREQGTPAQAEATDMRRRAFTLMSKTYEDARAAVRFLRRREDDAEQIAPTLYVKVRRSKAEDHTEVPDGSVAPPAPGSAPGSLLAAGGMPAASATATGGAAGGTSANGPFMPVSG
jgi:hypothetical protein